MKFSLQSFYLETTFSIIHFNQQIVIFYVENILFCFL